jgi:hypothetical protein
MLTMLEDGRNPFGAEEVKPTSHENEIELEEVVDALDAADVLPD